MSESTSVPKSILNETIISGTIQAMSLVSEALVIAFDSLEADGRPLSEIQKIAVMQNVTFCMRTLESDVRENVAFMLTMYYGLRDGDLDDLLTKDFKDLPGFKGFPSRDEKSGDDEESGEKA